MSTHAPFEKFSIGDFVTSRNFWRVHVIPAPTTDAEYAAQRKFIEDAIHEKLERTP